MQYIALIYDDGKPPADPEAMMQAYGAFNQELVASGQFIAGDALQPASTATSVRVRGGKTEVIDGPFAETKEQLGGYYLMECENLDQAVAWAAKIPNAQTGTVEVRPIMVYDV
jgi:hypothetical protein